MQSLHSLEALVKGFPMIGKLCFWQIHN